MRIPLMIGGGVVGGGKAPIVYLLRDEFTTDDNAPLTSPRTCEPGPGTLTITDAANKLSISGGKLVKTAGTWKMVYGPIARKSGLAFSIRGTHTTAGATGGGVFGTSEDGTNLTDGFASFSSVDYPYVTKSDGVETSQPVIYHGSNANVEALVIQRSAGSFIFARGGRFGKWTLLYPGSESDGASNYWIATNGFAANTGVLDDAIIAQLGGVFATDFGFASYHSATPATGVSTTASRDSLVEITWTPAAGETLEIYLRQVDADNRQIVRCSQAGSTIAILRETSGSETSMQSVAQTWTEGTPYKIVASCLRDGFKVSVNAAIKLAQATVVNEFGTTFSAAGFATAANFAVYPLGVSNLPAPYDMTGWRWLLGYGDSKTYVNDNLMYLSDLLETSTGKRWCFNTIGRSGTTVAAMAAIIASDLASFTVSSESPESVLINLGTNDAASLPAEATWKANYRVIIEALHAKWPSANIYLAKPVRLSGSPPSTPTAAVATMHGYIDGLVGEYDYVYAGMDETALEGGDSYVTNFADSLHPNAVGYAAGAALWKTVLGL